MPEKQWMQALTTIKKIYGGISLILFAIWRYYYKFKWRQEVREKCISQEIFTYKGKVVRPLNLCDQPIPVSIQSQYP